MSAERRTSLRNSTRFFLALPKSGKGSHGRTVRGRAPTQRITTPVGFFGVLDLSGPLVAHLANQGEEAIGLFNDQGDPLAQWRGEQLMELPGKLVLPGRNDHSFGEGR